MKTKVFYVCALVCTLGLMTSCDHRITPETMSGTYQGKIEVKLNVPGNSQDDLEFPHQAIVTKAGDAYVDVAIDLDLSTLLGEPLAGLLGENMNFGTVTARCLVGPTVDGEAPLSGTVTIGAKSIPVYGEYDERTLDITYPLGVVTVEFEGVRR
ncbi:MAG: hypothetical protein IKJ18_06395 [Bacteroidaceae bacterium]|nr:hypothetical protein [Bacteroidaceae bacterium]